MARDAAVIHDLGLQLHQRLAGVLTHLGTLGTSLQRTVDAYNSTIGSVDSRLGVTARRLAELDALGDVPDAPRPPVIHDTCRPAGPTARPLQVGLSWWAHLRVRGADRRGPPLHPPS